MTQEKFLKLLFDDGQQTCFATQATGYKVSKMPTEQDVFFCINALDPKTDKQPTESWHRFDLPRRADCNVVCFRNFLIELDNMPIKEQIEYVTARVPVSSITFSGAKSYHFIISLMTPLTSLEEYQKFAAGLHRLLDKADKSTKNPSRLSRLPWATRPETGLKQELVYLGDRIYASDMPKFPDSPYKKEQPRRTDHLFVSQQIREAQSIGPDRFIQLHFTGRNQFFYWLHKRCSELNHTREEKRRLVQWFYDKLENKRNFSIREAFLAARVKVD